MKIHIDENNNITYEGDFPSCNCGGMLVPCIRQNISYQPVYGYYSVPELIWKCNKCGKEIK